MGEAIAGAPGVRLARGAAFSAAGLQFAAGAAGSSVAYLAITDFTGYGIDILASSVSVSNCYVGLAPDGVTDAGNSSSGIHVNGGSAVIGDGAATRNVISGNGQAGIVVDNGAAFSVIRGNRIGTNAAGTAAVANASHGISGLGANDVIIGTSLPGDGNLISGNGGNGINFSGVPDVWKVRGNWIGLTASGAAALPNAGAGVWLNGTGHLLGGTTAEMRNVISGNTGTGVIVQGASHNIQGNYIGTNAGGTSAVPNGSGGIRAMTVSSGTIGGTTAGAGNLISGNASQGISLDNDTSGVVITGNLVGTNAAGTAALANTGSGVSLGGSSHTLGGTTAAARNVISGNTNTGVVLRGASNSIQGNYIGTNAAGNGAIPNGSGGIRAISVSSGTIGGATAGAGNLISGNTSNGISLDGDTSALVMAGNWIGSNAAGTAALANQGSGVYIGGTGHLLGGTTAAARNVISGNAFQGITLQGSGHSIQGNYIGTNAAGTAAIPNTGGGIRAITATGSTIGGTAAGAGNLISGNSSNGISLDGDTSALVIAGNRIGTNAAGNAALANQQYGIGVGGADHVIGGSTAAARNLISGNGSQGILLSGSNHLVQGNYIGTDATGAFDLGNNGYGVRIYDATGGELGGDTVAKGNLISGNSRGVSFEQGATGLLLRNNIIGLNASMLAKLPNSGNAIDLFTSGNTIGTAGAGNVLSGNDRSGILISGHASGNLIQGNWIGTNKALAAGLGNLTGGIYITDGYDNFIGGPGAGEGNVIAYNAYVGAWIERGDGNDFSRNAIYGNDRLGIDVGELGPQPNDAQDADIAGNRRQNFPLLTSVLAGATTEVDGLLKNEPNTLYRVEFFTSPSCDLTGLGEGDVYFATVDVLTGPDGTGVIDASLAPTAAPFMSATVTDPQGNTSEFSPCAKTTGPNPGVIQFFNASVLSYEGVLPTAKVAITRSQGMAGTVTANFTVSDQSAFAGSDYVDSDQVVTFLDGEVIKIVEIPLVPDLTVEGTENANLALATPTGGATLGTAASLLYIFDEDIARPGIIVDDVSITEGNSGQQQMTFNVHLSASDHQVTVGYLSESGTAVAGEDFTLSSGTLVFPASANVQTQTVNVPITGDATTESDEILWLRMTVISGGGTWVAYDAYGLGLIVNDDGIVQPVDTIFENGFD
ncbi:MAG: right-handed parallel beta-helix repeat-containing protein [Rhodanobacteraceae bacterium]|nr:right-handed parallel beta-helix repeat-containing protein [Rhodanobacteraceae bacterium]